MQNKLLETVRKKKVEITKPHASTGHWHLNWFMPKCYSIRLLSVCQKESIDVTYHGGRTEILEGRRQS